MEETIKPQNKPEKNWKDNLMKTGFPLEYIVRNYLNYMGHKTLGTFPYIRPDENDAKREFSIDIKTLKNLYHDQFRCQINLLIECKYRHQNTSWLFSRYPNHYINYGLINTTEFLTPNKLGIEYRFDFEKNLIYCDNGTEINSNTAKSDELRHGIYQLKFSQPVLYKTLCINTLNTGVLNFICPILITTADLRVLHDNLNLNDFSNAKTLDDISEVKEAVIYSEESGPQLSSFANTEGHDLVHQYPEIIKRLSSLSALHERDFEEPLHDIPFLFSSFYEVIDKVLIINLKYLTKMIIKIENSIYKDLENREAFGRFELENNVIKLFDNNGNLYRDFN